MPQVILPSIRDTDNPELKYQYLYDAYVKLQKELSFLLGNLDSDNVLEAQSVIADWVYAGTVTTDQLIAGEAKIGTALIEDLVVGGNVAMGDNATISWSKVTNQPSIPTVPGYIKSTYIDEVSIESPSISGGTITGVTISGSVLLAGVNTQIRLRNDSSNFGTIEFVAANNTQASIRYENTYSELHIAASNRQITMEASYIVLDASSVYLDGNIYINDKVVATQTWVTSNFADENHTHGNDYVKSYTGQNLSLVATESGIAVRVNGVTLGSIFYS